MWSMNPTLCSSKPPTPRTSGSSLGFGTSPDGGRRPRRLYRRLRPPCCCWGPLLCALMASAGAEAPERRPVGGPPPGFTAAASWSALLAFALPYQKAGRGWAPGGGGVWPAGRGRPVRPGGLIVSDSGPVPHRLVHWPPGEGVRRRARKRVVGLHRHLCSGD